MRSPQPSKSAVRKGFTLMEVVIAVGIFSVVVVAASSIFIRLNAVQRKNQTKMDILNEVRFSVDLIGQEVLSGSAFPTGCDTGCTTTVATPFVFATKIRPDVPLRRIEYYLDTVKGTLMRGEQKTFGVCSTIPFLPLHPECYAPLTTSKVSITQLTFYVINKVQDKQPVVTIVVNGSIQGEAFQLSSSFSPRFLQDPLAGPPSDNVLPTIQITNPTALPAYSTGNSSIPLGGTASDNVGVQSVTWTNRTNGTSGYAVSSNGFITWATEPSSPITLIPGEDNTIVVVATDNGGNASADTLVVTSTAPLSTPTLSADAYCWTDDGNFYIDLNMSSVSGATSYTVERCTGDCSGGGTFAFFSNGGTYQYDGPALGPSETYSYQAYAYNSNSGASSGYSNISVATTPSSCAYIPPSTTSGSGSGSNSGTPGGGTGGPSGTISLSASPNYVLVSVTGGAGTYRDSGSATITVNSINGFSGSVSFTCSGFPSGAGCNFSPSSVNAGGSVSFRLSVPNDAAEGDYGGTVYASGGGASDSTGVTLHVSHGGGGQQ